MTNSAAPFSDQPEGRADLPIASPASEDQRTSIILLLDTSESMGRSAAPPRPIDDLNNALKQWRTELQRHPQVSRFGEVAIVTFGGVATLQNLQKTTGRPNAINAFIPVNDFAPPAFEASGQTPMVDAIRLGIRLGPERKDYLLSIGVETRFRPLVWLLTDGCPTDSDGRPTDAWRSVVQEIREGEAARSFLFSAIGLGSSADEVVLRGLAPAGTYLFREGVSFTELLKLVSSSVAAGLQEGASLRNAAPEAVHDAMRRRTEAIEQIFGHAG